MVLQLRRKSSSSGPVSWLALLVHVPRWELSASLPRHTHVFVRCSPRPSPKARTAHRKRGVVGGSHSRLSRCRGGHATQGQYGRGEASRRGASLALVDCHTSEAGASAGCAAPDRAVAPRSALNCPADATFRDPHTHVNSWRRRWPTRVYLLASSCTTTTPARGRPTPMTTTRCALLPFASERASKVLLRSKRRMRRSTSWGIDDRGALIEL